MENGFRTGAILGDLVFGKPDGKVYGEQMERNMRTAKLMEEARNARSRNLAMDEMTPEKFAAAYGVTPEIGALLSSATRTQDSANLNILGATPLAMQEYQMRKDALESGRPVLGDMNANLAAIAGKPVEVNTIDNGYQLNKYEVGGEALPTLGEITDAELTRAKVGTEGARAGQLDALGSKYSAQAALGGFAPKVATVKTMTESEADTKEQWIVAQANEMTIKGKSPEYVEAWIANEMVKAGMEPEPTVVKSLGQPKHVGRTKPAGIAPQGVDQGLYAKALQRKADAIRAIERGAPKNKVAERLRSTGNAKLADWLLENY